MFSGKGSIDDTAILIEAYLIKPLCFALPICIAPVFFDIAVAIGIRQLPWVANLHSTPFLLHPYIPLQAPARAGGTQGLWKMKAERF